MGAAFFSFQEIAPWKEKKHPAIKFQKIKIKCKVTEQRSRLSLCIRECKRCMACTGDIKAKTDRKEDRKWA